jgi:hypothetical protein
MCATIAKAFLKVTTPAKKLDLRKRHEDLYDATPDATLLVMVPPLDYIMVDGEGDPNTAVAFPLAVESLFALAYGLKFAMRAGSPPVDYQVMPLEGLWWSDDPSGFSTERRDQWKWTLMILVPDLVTQDLFLQTVAEVEKKKPLTMLRRVRLQRLDEGRSAQVLHVGPYTAEGESIAKILAFASDHEYRMHGKHHEIYLNDPKRTPPAKLRTILRHPVG